MYGSTREKTVHIAGFRGAYRDAALRESVQPPEVHPPVDSDEADVGIFYGIEPREIGDPLWSRRPLLKGFCRN